MPEQPQDAVQVLPIPDAHPPPTIPTIFADGVPNIAPSRMNVKCYLYRTEPHPTGAGPALNQVVGD